MKWKNIFYGPIYLNSFFTTYNEYSIPNRKLYNNWNMTYEGFILLFSNTL